ncbi:MAG: hypothetical protein MUP19_04875 [Candidatus Aminicenantes bacterium]|nr:hypothetical protein [Candidatus Aminicenantes bacterium]
MKIAKLSAAAFTLGLLLLGFCPAVLQGQQPVSKEKVIGTWDIEILTEGQSYYLTMVLSENEGRFEGKISEQNGFFTDVPLTALDYDGQILTFEFNSPTPPDGMQRQILCEFNWAGENLEGTVTVPDLAMTVPAKAVKKV